MASEYSQEIQHKRFDKEISLLTQIDRRISTSSHFTPFGMIIRAELSPEILQGIYNHPVIFDIHLEGKYPFQPPKLLCESVIGFPSCADGRDILLDVTNRKWTPNITASEIIRILPSFVSRLVALSQSKLQSLDIGKLHLGSPMYLETWDRKDSMGCFYGYELDLKDPRVARERVLVVSHTVILELDLSTNYPGIGHLLSWATLQSLNSIKKSKIEKDRLTFEWKKIGENPEYRQIFKLREAEACIELIAQNLHRLGAIVKKNSKLPLLKEEEMTGKATKSMNIKEILQAISIYESNFDKRMSVEMVNSLMALYQQAIEFFSANNDSQYDIFVERLHNFLSNDIVLMLLASEKEDAAAAKEQKEKEENKVQEEIKKEIVEEIKENEKEIIEEIKENEKDKIKIVEVEEVKEVKEIKEVKEEIFVSVKQEEALKQEFVIGNEEVGDLELKDAAKLGQEEEKKEINEIIEEKILIEENKVIEENKENDPSQPIDVIKADEQHNQNQTNEENTISNANPETSEVNESQENENPFSIE